MNLKDIRTRKLGFLGMLRTRFGRCPDCGGQLNKEMLPELIESWSYAMPRYIARTLGNRPAPQSHVTETPVCWHCSQCDQWYSGARAYWKVV